MKPDSNKMEDPAMNVVRRSLTLGLLAVLAATIPAMAQSRPDMLPFSPPPPMGGPGFHGGPPDPAMGMAGRILHDLDLTEEQQTQIHDLLRGSMTGPLGRLAQSFGEARHLLEVRIWDPASTDQDVADAHAVMAERSRQLEVARRRLAADVLAVMTEEQRAAFQQMLREPPPPPREPRGPGGPSRRCGTIDETPAPPTR